MKDAEARRSMVLKILHVLDLAESAVIEEQFCTNEYEQQARDTALQDIVDVTKHLQMEGLL